MEEAARIITAELARGHTCVVGLTLPLSLTLTLTPTLTLPLTPTRCVVGLTSTSEAAQRRAEQEESLEDFSGLQQCADNVLKAAEAALAKPGDGEAVEGGAGGGVYDSDDGGGGGGGGGGDEDDGDDDDGGAAGGADIEMGAEIEITLSQAERQEGEARLPAMRRRLQAMILPGSPLDTLIGLLGGPGNLTLTPNP